MVFAGKKLALKKENELARRVVGFKKKFGRVPKLVAIQVGENPASELYLKMKKQAAGRVGIDFEVEKFPSLVGLTLLLHRIRVNNKNPRVDGIMVQLPLPEKLGTDNSKLEVLGSIEPTKDVDCLTPENLGRLLMGKPRFLPATVRAVIEIIGEALGSPAGKNVVIVGGSNIVGKPLAMVLSNLGATVTVCRSKTKDLGSFTRRAEILVSATSISGLIKAKMVKRGAIVIDVGSPKGDVDFEEVKKVASFITPVPGGVGPITVVCLLENVLEAAQGFCK